MKLNLKLTIVIPAYNEADNLLKLIAEIRVVFSVSTMIIVVDDGSDDKTAAIIQAAIHDDYLLLVRHRRRYGQSAAIRSGVRAAKTDWVATLDGDGQNDPCDLTKLGTWAGAPADFVGGLRRYRQDSWSKRVGSYWANRVRRLILGDECSDSACGIRIFRRQSFFGLPYFASMHRFLPALFQAYGYQVRFVEVNHRKRWHGRSKYRNWRRALIGLVDLIGVYWLIRRTELPSTASVIKHDSSQFSYLSKDDPTILR